MVSFVINLNFFYITPEYIALLPIVIDKHYYIHLLLN